MLHHMLQTLGNPRCSILKGVQGLLTPAPPTPTAQEWHDVNGKAGHVQLGWCRQCNPGCCCGLGVIILR